MNAWNVYLNGKKVETVFFNSRCDGGARIDAQQVKESLVNHDGYNPSIEVRNNRKLSRKDKQP